MTAEPHLTDPVSQEEIRSIMQRLCALDCEQLRSVAVNLSWALAERLVEKRARFYDAVDPDADLDDVIGHASMRLLDQAMQTLDGSKKVDWSVFESPTPAKDSRGPFVADDGQSDDTGEHFFSSYGTPHE